MKRYDHFLVVSARGNNCIIYSQTQKSVNKQIFPIHTQYANSSLNLNFANVSQLEWNLDSEKIVNAAAAAVHRLYWFVLLIWIILQKDAINRIEYKFESCGEWNNDFVALNGGGENEADAINQANQVLDDVNRNVVMI